MADRNELWEQAQEKAHELYRKMKAALAELPATEEGDAMRKLILEWMDKHLRLFPEDN